MDKIEQLRFRLISSGVDVATADDIIETALSRIKDRVVSSIEAGVNLAFESSSNLKARGFEKDIRVSYGHRGLEIESARGGLDYSTPPFPMLDRLLAKGKTAKDGSLYRVIPLGSSSKETVVNVDTSESVSQAKEVTARRSLTDMSRQIANAFNTGTKVVSKEIISKNSSQPNFKTASSKQDRSTQWVIPAREADLTPAISDINAMIAADMERAVDDVLADMEWEVRDAIYNA